MVVEGLCGVFACEGAGFGGGDEELFLGGGVDGDFVDGFMGDLVLGVPCVEAGLWEPVCEEVGVGCC